MKEYKLSNQLSRRGGQQAERHRRRELKQTKIIKI